MPRPWDNNDLIRKLQEAIAKRDALYAEKQKNPAAAETDQEEAPSSLDEMEKLTIQRVLESSGRNLTTAAEKLGISRQTLYNKMKHHGIL